jgi:hypothetical protein
MRITEHGTSTRLSLRLGWTPGGRRKVRVDAVGRFAVGGVIAAAILVAFVALHFWSSTRSECLGAAATGHRMDGR